MVASRSELEALPAEEAIALLGVPPADPLNYSMWKAQRRWLEERARRESLTAEERAAEDARLKARIDEAEAQRIANERYAEKRRLAEAHFPLRLIEQLLDHTFRGDTAAHMELISALRDGKKIVVLSGPAGCGKTVAACMAAAAGHGSFYFLSAWDRTHTSAYSDDADEWTRNGYLVLDDVGEEYADAKGFSASMLDQLISERYDNDVVTVITTNLPAPRFTERCGERIVDRIREVGVFIELAEPSMRTKKPDA